MIRFLLLTFTFCSYLVNGKLYNSSDIGIDDLEDNNFYEHTKNKQVVFLAEFYASWCGHCVNFAPKFKALAQEISSWNKVVQLVTIDCGHESCCTETCRHFNIQSYPTLKYLPPYFDRGKDEAELVTVPPSHTVDSLRDNLVDYLTNLKGKTPKHWPHLNFFNESMWQNFQINRTAKDILVIVESETSYLGREIILDLSHYTDAVQIIRAKPDCQWLNEHSKLSKNIPYILKFEDKKSSPSLYWSTNDRTKFPRKTITALIKSDYNIVITTHKPKIMLPPTTPPSVSQASDDLYIDDLYRSLRYTLYKEIPRLEMLDSNKLDILKRLLHVIIEYFPFISNQDREVVSNLLQYLSTVGPQLSRDTYLNSLTQFDDSNSNNLNRFDDYKTCKGSSPSYRGYSCSLWILFHTLTVQEYLAQQKDPMKKNQHQVLISMRDYIPTFFGCRECARHFRNMSKDVQKSLIHSNSSMLWLWQAHNKVNLKLAGSASEDPAHKKELYPPENICQICYNLDGKFNEEVVLTFLLRKYEKANIFGYQELVKSANKPALEAYRKELRNSTEKAWQWPNLFLNGLDMSLCLVLYVITSFMLLTFCFILGIRRRRKRDHRGRHMYSP